MRILGIATRISGINMSKMGENMRISGVNARDLGHYQ